MDKQMRWMATIFYKLDAASIVLVEHHIEEIDELAELVEQGPDWNTIDKIEIVLQRRLYGEIISIEDAEKL